MRFVAAIFACVAAVCVVNPRLAAFEPSGKLEIHYINVGQGGATLVIGPNGTRILYDFGNVAGETDIVPYLRGTVRLDPSDGLHYTIVSHRDRDHYTGYRGVIESGYDVTVANYGPGSDKGPSVTMNRNWLTPAADKTTAGAVRPIPLGLRISLGDGAEAVVVAANGAVLGERRDARARSMEKALNENDRSVALFINYGGFDYIIDGDLGAGKDSCAGHKTTQIDVQTRVALALISQKLIDPKRGVDVMHVAHHGSESSTSQAYFDLLMPELALISVGLKQRSFRHPREAVVDKVLIDDGAVPRPDCVDAPPVTFVLQTEEGKAGGSGAHRTSFSGRPVGDIKIVTDGRTGYVVSGSGRVHGGNAKPMPPTHFDLD